MAPQTGTALLVIAVFVLPGFVTLLIRERTYRVKDQDSPFERLLNAELGLMLRVTLEDGRVVGGYFGDKSLAGYTGRTRDLFIEQQWLLDVRNWFEEPAKGSAGLWIAEDQILSIEAYGPADILLNEYNSFQCDSDATRETTTTVRS